MYAISVSDGSTFLHSIKACRLMMEYGLLYIYISRYIPGEYNNNHCF